MSQREPSPRRSKLRSLRFRRRSENPRRDKNSHLAANAVPVPAYATGRQRRGCGNSAPPFSATGSGGTEFLSKPDPLRWAPISFFGGLSEKAPSLSLTRIFVYTLRAAAVNTAELGSIAPTR